MNVLLALLFVAALLAAWLGVQTLWLRLEGTGAEGGDALAGRLGCGRACGCEGDRCRREDPATNSNAPRLPGTAPPSRP